MMVMMNVMMGVDVNVLFREEKRDGKERLVSDILMGILFPLGISSSPSPKLLWESGRGRKRHRRMN